MTGFASRVLRRQAVFGAADGVTIILALLVTLAGQPHALIRAAAGAALAEFVGMTAGQWLSDGRSGFRAALANGGSSAAACMLPAVPYLVAGGTTPVVVSLGSVAVITALIAWLRPERGVLAIAQTYGVLAVAAVLCAAVSFI